MNINTAVGIMHTRSKQGTTEGETILQFGAHAADTVQQIPSVSCNLLLSSATFLPLLVFASTKCETALRDRLELATTVALQAGAAMKLVINMKNKNVIHKGVIDL